MNNHRAYLVTLPVYSAIASFVLFLIFESVLFRLGESGDLSEIVDLQRNENTLFGQRYSNEKIDYKVEGAKIADPDILILGTSRIMLIDEEALPANKVYNAGLSASVSEGLSGMDHILNSFSDERYPSCVIMGLDPWIFNPNYPPNLHMHKAASRFKMRVKEKLGAALSLRIFLRDEIEARANRYASLIHERSRWVTFLFADRSHQGIGLNAKLLNSGFRVDGSFQYPAGYQEAWKEPEVEDHITSLQTDSYRFAASSSVDSVSIGELNRILDFSRQKNMLVIGLLPPFSPNFDRALKAMPSHSVFYQEYQDSVCASFTERGFECYNFTDISQYEKLRSHGHDFTDSMHPKIGLVKGMVEIIQKENKQIN